MGSTFGVRSVSEFEFNTKHIGLACFLRYALGDDTHVATVKAGEKSFLFYFVDSPRGKCQELADAFFSEQGAAIDNARELLQCEREIKLTIKTAYNSPDGEWER